MIADKLIDYADRKLLVKELMVWAQEQNPRRYAEHGPYGGDIPWSQDVSSQTPPTTSAQNPPTKTETVQSTATTSQYETIEIFISKTAEANTLSARLKVVGENRLFDSRTIKLDQNQLSNKAEEYGLDLGKALFQGTDLALDYQTALAVLQNNNQPWRLRLQLNDLDLHTIRWERLHHRLSGAWQPIAVTISSPFSRYISADDWRKHEPVALRPLKALVVVASPKDLPDYGLTPIEKQERESIHQIFDSLPQIEAHYLETDTDIPPTLTQLRKALIQGYHLIHFVCHGRKMARSGETLLYLEDETGDVAPVTAKKLSNSFYCRRKVSLVLFFSRL